MTLLLMGRKKIQEKYEPTKVKSRPSIAIIIDNPRRDLRGLVLLSHQFLKMGAKIYLVPMYQQGYDIPLIKPDLVIVNYIRENNRALIEGYRSLGIRIAVLDTEGGILSESGLDSPESWAKSLKNSGMIKLVDDYCFWGSSVYSAFEKHSGLASSAMSVTGCPRYDLVNTPWSEALQYKRKGFILVNTNFSAINPMFTESAKHEQRIFESLGWDPVYIEKLFSDLIDVFPKYLAAIELIATTFPEKIIQVRPHPFENPHLYREHYKFFRNVVIDEEGDIFNAIKAADCIVHLNCGSSVDAIRAGKLPISLEYLNTPALKLHTPLPSQLSWQVNSAEELVKAISMDMDENAFDWKLAQKIIEPWYHYNDGNSAHRVASFLSSRVSDSRDSKQSLGLSISGGRLHPTPLQIFKGLVSTLLGTYRSSRLFSYIRKARDKKSFQKDYVLELLTAYSKFDEQSVPSVRFSRNPYTGARLATLELIKDE